MVAWALGIAAVFSLLYTLALPGSGIENGMHPGAWRGPFMQKNGFARLLVVSALAILLVALNTRRYRYLVWTVFGIAVALLVLSNSKTALVIFLNLVVLLPFYRALRWSNNLAVPFFITLILLGGSTATWFMDNWDNVLLGLGKDSTLSGRTDIWDAAIEKIWERPWLGYGYQAFWQEGGGAELVWRSIRYKIFQAHNGLLDIGVQLGFLGMLFFVLSVVFTFIRAIKWARLGKSWEDLWPILYVTFLPLYNYTESTTVGPNSITWVLFVAISLSLKLLPVVNPEEESESLSKERLVEQL
jgi:O-antigen ligase